MLAETRTQTRKSEESKVVAGVPVWLTMTGRVFILAGGCAIALAIASDLFGIGGRGGFGLKQVKLAVVGGCALLSGVGLASSLGQKYIREWLLLSLSAVVVLLASIPLEDRMTPSTIVRHVTLPTTAGILLAVAAGVAWPRSRQYVINRWRSATVDLSGLAKMLVLIAQLGLLILTIRQFDLENAAFYGEILTLTLLGFVVHSVLPVRYRLPFFVLLCVAAIASVFGFVDGAWLLAIGLVLIGISHLPVAFGLRVGLLLITATGLALLRTEWAASQLALPWSIALWPILGSMFMFRLIVYMYDLRHQKEPVNISRTLAYFFLFPNVVFPLFPVVDFTTFRRTYYNEEPYHIYQTGITWMVRGTFHLILYRFVSYYLLIGPEDVANLSDLARYLAANFLLYLRISGQFHLIVGMLHLFGFNLPETHHLYFLASSFTDFWRRINIYWKDFMLKVCYYPAYFRLRRLGATTGLVLATFIVFLLTWFFHAYQWFWLRGTYLLTLPDMGFWAILAVLVVINSLYEMKRGRKRRLSGHTTWTWQEVGGIALRTSATFTALCVLWSLWTSPSIAEWLVMWSTVRVTWNGVAVVFAVLILVGVAAGFYYIREQGQAERMVQTKQPAFFRPAAATAIAIVLLYIAGNPIAHSQLAGKPQEILQGLTISRLSDQDAELLERGYYEDLTGVNRFNSQLWEIYMKRPTVWPILQETEAARPTGDFLLFELKPSASIIYNGAPLTVNSLGLRDQEYSLEKPPDVYRMALLGASHAMGSGVANGEPFEALLEQRINDENNGEVYSSYEILNFAVNGYSALQSLFALEHKVIPFEPNVVALVATPEETARIAEHLSRVMLAQVDIPYPFVQDLVEKAGIHSQSSALDVSRRLKPYDSELLAWTFRQFVATARANDILPIMVLIPVLDAPRSSLESPELLRLASDAGFIVLDLQDVYDGRRLESLWVAEWDHHPNAQGHQLIADQLHTALLDHHEDIPLSLWP